MLALVSAGAWEDAERELCTFTWPAPAGASCAPSADCDGSGRGGSGAVKLATPAASAASTSVPCKSRSCAKMSSAFRSSDMAMGFFSFFKLDLSETFSGRNGHPYASQAPSRPRRLRITPRPRARGRERQGRATRPIVVPCRPLVTVCSLSPNHSTAADGPFSHKTEWFAQSHHPHSRPPTKCPLLSPSPWSRCAPSSS